MSGKEPTIMIVDDTPANLKLLDDMLAAKGYRVVAFPSGELALKALVKSRPDMILLDVMMPGMDGFTACRLIKGDPGVRDIPVVMVTALNQVEDRVKALEAGADDFLNKPVDPSELIARIKLSLEIKRLRDKEKEYIEQITVEKDRLDELLHAVLPPPIVDRLKAGENTIADNFAKATVIFLDIVGFTEHSSRIPPAVLIQLLSKVFNRLDELADYHGIEKIKTIGDAYLAVGGVPVQHEDHLWAAADFAIDAVRETSAIQWPDGTPIEIRIGIDTGPVTAGVIDRKRLIYDLWGNTVNVASRLESQSEPGRIHLSEATATLLAGKYQCEPRGPMEIRGKGVMSTYFLVR